MEKEKKISKKEIDLAILKELNKLNSKIVTKENIKDLKKEQNIKTILVSFMGVVGLMMLVLGVGLILEWNNYVTVGLWILAIASFIAIQD